MRNFIRKNRNRASLGVKLSLLLTLLVCLGLITPAFPQFPRKVRTVAAKLVAKLPFRRKPPQTKPVLAQRPGYANLSEEEQFDKPDEAAEFFRLKRLPEGETEIPVEKYLTAREQMDEMPQYATAENHFLPSRNELARQTGLVASPEVLGAWTSLGPGNVGGRTRALIVHPSTPTTMYAAGVAGGVWKTTNGGSSWTPLTDLIANLAVGSLAMDPTNTNIIYAGTGEFYAGDGLRGAGIFKTTDGGANWTRLANTNNADFYYVNKVIVSPVSGQRVYAATSTGIWRSIDGGANWTQVLTQPTCDDLVARTGQGTDYLFATCRPGNQGTIYRNTDASGAGVWTSVYTEAGMARTSLALAPSSQSTIYALSASSLGGPGNNYFSGLHAVFRSTSSGDIGSWTARVRNTDPVRLNTLLLTYPQGATFQQCGFGSDFYSNQGGYDNVIAVDLVDPNRVWTGGIALFRSDDGGANWGIASCYPHPDVHAIVFHPQFNGTSNKTMFIGNDGGIEKTDDARAPVKTNPCDNTCDSFATFTDLNNSYGVTQFYHGLPYPDGATYFGGTQDNGTQRGSDSGGANNWKFILGGDGGYVAVDPTNTAVLYAETTFLSIQKTTNGNNASPTWTPATTGITDSAFSFPFINPFVMDPSNSQRLWTGSGKLWRTDNGAGNWSQASAALTGTVSAITVAPTDSNYVLAGTTSGNIHRTTVGTSAVSSTVWPNVQPRSGYVSGVTFDPANKNLAYATYSTFGGTHVWKSTNAGATWVGLDGTVPNNLPDIPVNCIVVDPTNSSRLYVGTDLGVFSSLDGGANWAVENTGFANVITESLAVNSGATKYLFAFTHGRGVWRVQVSAPPNTTPTFTPAAAVSRQQGSPAGAAVQVGTAADAETLPGSLVVTQIAGGTATGINVTGITNTNGAITAQVSAACNATAGTVRFQVSDGTLMDTGDLQVNVTANTQPTLTYNNANANAGTATTVSPTTGPSDNGSISSIVVQSVTPSSAPATITVNNTTGVVSVPNNIPAGTYTVTIRATDNCTVVRDASFTLTVAAANTAPSFTPAAAVSRQQGSPAGAAVQVGTAADAQTLAGSLVVTQIAGGTATGINVTGITNTNGVITAQVSAACNATAGTVRFQVSDGTLMGTGDLQVNVTANTQPTLTYNNANANAGTATTVSPATGPSDNGSISSIVVQSVTPSSAPATITVNNTTGVVSVPNNIPVGTYTVTIRATDNCTTVRDASFTLTVTSTCQTITVNPAALANGFVGTAYSQTLTATGGTAPFTFAITTGSLPGGLTLASGGALTGTPTTAGTFNFTVTATDNTGCTGTRSYTVIVSGNGMQFYPLATPVRLLDTRPGTSPGACSQPNAPIAGATARIQPARNFCGLPANARAITGNVTTVQSGGGFLTLYPSDAAQPTVASTNYGVNEVINNVFTVGLGAADGAFKIFALNTTDVIVDVTGYYAPPATGGLYFHPLPSPVRLLETRAGQAIGCVKPGAPLAGGQDSLQTATTACTGIPAAARAIVGNATTVSPQGAGFLTLFPADAARPTVASSNYNFNQVVNGPFTVGLSPAGQFKIFTLATTDLIVDVLGYYSTEATDANGAGLLFTPLAHPVRLLETRSNPPNLTGCFKPNAPLNGNQVYTQAARGLCDGVTVPGNALGVVGNATVITPLGGGFLTLWPSTVTQPTAATANYGAGGVVNRHFIVGLGAGDGAFKMFSLATTDLVIDLSGYFAP